ncbi:MAG: ABC transporter permease subunit [Chloroflexota bacterium]
MLIWGVALSMIPVIYIGLYPAFADQLSNFTEMLDLPFYQALGIQMGTFEEYMASTATNLIPLILAIYAVTTGTAALAGEEEDGRLELIVALPIPRWQIVAVKAVAIGITLLIILAITGAGAALTLLALGDQVETVDYHRSSCLPAWSLPGRWRWRLP